MNIVLDGEDGDYEYYSRPMSIGSFEASPSYDKLEPGDVGCLFVLRFSLFEPADEILKSCFFDVYFRNKLIGHLFSNETKVVVFPQSLEKSMKNTLYIKAYAESGLTAKGKIDINKETNRLIEQFMITPTPELTEHRSVPMNMGNCLATLNVKLEMSLLGRIVTDDKFLKPEEKVKKPEYDEYSADINGHSVVIKILKKNDENEKKDNGSSCGCDCANIPEIKPKIDYCCVCERENNVSRGDVGRTGSQIIFQMPNKRELCTKEPPNVLCYNVNTCQQGPEHGHKNDRIKILAGSHSTQNDPKGTDTFVLRIGKKGYAGAEQGRLELELTAPKPVTEEHFKKPTKEKSVQTKETGDPEKMMKKGRLRRRRRW